MNFQTMKAFLTYGNDAKRIFDELIEKFNSGDYIEEINNEHYFDSGDIDYQMVNRKKLSMASCARELPVLIFSEFKNVNLYNNTDFTDDLWSDLSKLLRALGYDYHVFVNSIPSGDKYIANIRIIINQFYNGD